MFVQLIFTYLKEIYFKVMNFKNVSLTIFLQRIHFLILITSPKFNYNRKEHKELQINIRSNNKTLLTKLIGNNQGNMVHSRLFDRLKLKGLSRD